MHFHDGITGGEKESSEERGFREDSLGRALAAALRSERAPDPWVKEALAVPHLEKQLADVRREPWALAKLCGLVYVLAFLVANVVYPEAARLAWRAIAPGAVTLAPDTSSLRSLLPLVVSLGPLLILIAFQNRRFLARAWLLAMMVP